MTLGSLNSQINISPQAFYCMKLLKCLKGDVLCMQLCVVRRVTGLTSGLVHS